MQRIKFMVKVFLHEPVWFKVLILSSLIISMVFSASYFEDQVVYEGISKLAAGIFFCAYGIKFRMNRRVSFLFYVLALFCTILAFKAIRLF